MGKEEEGRRRRGGGGGEEEGEGRTETKLACSVFCLDAHVPVVALGEMTIGAVCYYLHHRGLPWKHNNT